MDYRVVFVIGAGMHRDFYEPVIGFCMALAAGLFDVGLIDGGLGRILFIDIMQGVGCMAADAVGCFLRAQSDQFAMD